MGRRAKGTGYIEINKSLSTPTKKVYRAKFPVGTNDKGKTKYITIGSKFSSKAEANQALEEYRQRFSESENDSILFDVLLQEYLDFMRNRLNSKILHDNKSKKIKPKYYYSIESTIKNHLRPLQNGDGINTLHGTEALSLLPINQITREKIIDLCKELKVKKLSKSTIEKVVDCIRGAFNMREELLNPAIGIKIVDDDKKSKPVLSHEEMEKVINYFMNHYDIEGLAIVFLCEMAIRVGELCAIRIKSFFQREGYFFVYISETMSRVTGFEGEEGEKYIIHPTKSLQSNRPLQLTYNAQKVYKRVMEINKKYLDNSNMFFFHRTDKKGNPVPLDANHLGRVFKKGLQEIGIEGDYTLHSLRHSRLTLMLFAGVPLELVSMYAGHSSMEFTYRTYISTIKAIDSIKANDMVEQYQFKKFKEKHQLNETETELESFRKMREYAEAHESIEVREAYLKFRQEAFNRQKDIEYDREYERKKRIADENLRTIRDTLGFVYVTQGVDDYLDKNPNEKNKYELLKRVYSRYFLEYWENELSKEYYKICKLMTKEETLDFCKEILRKAKALPDEMLNIDSHYLLKFAHRGTCDTV